MLDNMNATEGVEATTVTAAQRALTVAVTQEALDALEASHVEFENARNAFGTAQLVGSPGDLHKAELRLSAAAAAEFSSQRAIDTAAQALVDARDGKVA